MQITLTADQEAWLRARVARGDFASVEDAVSRLLEERIAERAIDEDDLSWAKPDVEAGLRALAAGEVISLDELKERNAARLAALKG
ncbi:MULTISPECIES: hypothetical protein [Methylosinus]|uniref:Type II toxin-antitoxin system ParD family antitoxin n=1 Tax=Methylosinus trichosporium (strain ATCC 35070 / NCIMB 11131 / UNIQEM 75 / OB3b) TaxID=595536 RepID=A0A2D2CVH2_METT3|nr:MULTISPECIES: hypothetical protein [Methylosinus]ATQ66710.1 hypothetical protein CQW49_01470 [Methylosinus trichosporium OB3b]OBS53379.1 hypothetical protein A8B73_06280 [Methylosinus sp. 3S-1]